jgi:PAS domain-containing protein
MKFATKWLRWKNDITEKKAADHHMQHGDDRFRGLADAMPQIVWTANELGSFEYYNYRWYDFTGFPADKAAHELDRKQIIHPDDYDRRPDLAPTSTRIRSRSSVFGIPG